MAEQTSSKKFIWIGRILSGFIVLFLLFDAIIHVLNIPPVMQASHLLGMPDNMAFIAGILEFVCLGLYLLPKTSILGAILLTGYLGGAVATNLRAEMPLFSNTLFPVYVGLFVWGGLFFREKRVREIIPFFKR